jgi:hypothetical protein
MASENWGSQGNELEVGDFLEKWVLAQSVYNVCCLFPDAHMHSDI